jgi:DNA mismatch endonuclease (patch repair protein)
MSDVFTKKKRSSIMAEIRSTGNKTTELKLVAILRTNAFTGWRRKKYLFGKPDFVFERERLAVFVDGCFWHGCKAHCRMPATRLPYWSAKISRNRRRDRLVKKLLTASGWRVIRVVIRVWEHSLKNPERIVARLQKALGAEVKNPRLKSAKLRRRTPSIAPSIRYLNRDRKRIKVLHAISKLENE